MGFCPWGRTESVAAGYGSNLGVHREVNGYRNCHTYIYIYIYKMDYYSARKKDAFESVLMRWMNLEPIIQREVSQKGKDKYCILMHVYGI